MTSEGLEDLEEMLERLLTSETPPETTAEALKKIVESRIAHEHPHLAFLEASGHEDAWSDAQKLDLIERFTRAGMEAQAITLCHRWKLTRRFAKKHHDLFRILFPKLPPHPNEKETPDEG